jgi:hypothetical protein
VRENNDGAPSDKRQRFGRGSGVDEAPANASDTGYVTAIFVGRALAARWHAARLTTVADAVDAEAFAAVEVGGTDAIDGHALVAAVAEAVFVDDAQHVVAALIGVVAGVAFFDAFLELVASAQVETSFDAPERLEVAAVVRAALAADLAGRAAVAFVGIDRTWRALAATDTDDLGIRVAVARAAIVVVMANLA